MIYFYCLIKHTNIINLAYNLKFLPEKSVIKLINNNIFIMRNVLLTIIISILAGGISGYFTSNQFPKSKTNEVNYKQSFRDSVKMTQREVSSTGLVDFCDAAESAVEGVVYVKVVKRAKNYQPSNVLDLLFGYARTPKDQVGMGSGVIISEDGYIVTNNHVIEGADEIEVTTYDNQLFKAKLVGRDPATDIALLKVETTTPLPIIPMGNSDDLRLGEWVLAIGSPYDLRSTITAGIVSAKGRSLPNYDGKFRVESFIQTDAAVNPGNSGGALVNANGELVGINTSIVSLTGSYTGYSFAVPVSIVSKITDDLITFGEVRRAMLGISMQNINESIKQHYNLPTADGVLVVEVAQNSPAESAGIKIGDVIVEIDARPVLTGANVQELVSMHRPGEEMLVTVIREGARSDIIVKL